MGVPFRLGLQARLWPLIRFAGLVDSRKRHAGCGIGRGLHAVAVNGDIYPCHRFVGLETERVIYVHRLDAVR